MALSYDYDESDETWPFFLLTILLVVLVPATLVQIYKLFKSSKGKENEEDNDISRIERKYAPLEVLSFRQNNQKRGSLIFNKYFLFTILGWALVAVLMRKITNNSASREYVNIFDPYALLDVTTSATEREIKSAYRRLSVKFHPDKLAKDLTAEARTELEEQYVQITKAYKALTDDVTRENYLKYGHPDGPQSTTHGIALPKFLVEGTASPLVVCAYFLLLAILLPYLVASWWSKTQSYTAKGLNAETASYFVNRVFNSKPSEVVTVDVIISWLSHAKEYTLKYPDLTPKKIEKLFHDHIERKHSGALEKKKLDIVSKSLTLLYGLLDIATSFRNTEISLTALDTTKVLIQATKNSPYAQIFQLPNVDKDTFLKGNMDNVRTLGKLFTYDDAKIGQMLGITDSKALEETLKVAASIPHLKLIRAEFRVPGEANVTPLSMPHISLKVLVRSAKHKTFPPSSIPDELLEDPQDFDNLRDPFALNANQPLIPKTFAPYFPVERRGAWCCLVSLQKDGKVIQTPLIVTRLSFSNLSNDFDKRLVKDLGSEFNSADWSVGTIRIPLGQPAPPEKGDYYFRVIIKSTGYFGGDLDFNLRMEVRDPIVAKEPVDAILADRDDDESTQNDDETDSEDDENDFDNDGSDYTDIDTDTEVEDNDDGAAEKSQVGEQ